MACHRSLFLALGLLATTTALCAPDPQSYLDGNPETKTDPHLFPVQVITVDGALPAHNPPAVTPGPHWLELQTVADSPGTPSKTQTFVLKIEPCTYYHLGAHKDPNLLQKWKLVVDTAYMVKGCDPAEELKKVKDVPAQDPRKVHPSPQPSQPPQGQ